MINILRVELNPISLSAKLYRYNPSRNIPEMVVYTNLTYSQGLELISEILIFKSSGLIGKLMMQFGDFEKILSGPAGLHAKTLLLALNQNNKRHISISIDEYFNIIESLERGDYRDICNKTIEEYLDLSEGLGVPAKSIKQFLTRAREIEANPQIGIRLFSRITSISLKERNGAAIRELASFALETKDDAHFNTINSLTRGGVETFYKYAKCELTELFKSHHILGSYYKSMFCKEDPYCYYKNFYHLEKVRLRDVNVDRLIKSFEKCPRNEVSEIGKRISISLRYELLDLDKEIVKKICRSIKENAPAAFYDFCLWVVKYKGIDNLLRNFDLSGFSCGFYRKLFKGQDESVFERIFYSNNSGMIDWALDEIISSEKHNLKLIPHRLLTKKLALRIFAESKTYTFSSLPFEISNNKSMARESYILSKGRQPSFEDLRDKDAAEIFNSEIDRYKRNEPLLIDGLIDEDHCLKNINFYVRFLVTLNITKIGKSGVFDDFARYLATTMAILSKMPNDEAAKLIYNLDLKDEGKLKVLSRIMPISMYEHLFRGSCAWSKHADSRFSADLGL